MFKNFKISHKLIAMFIITGLIPTICAGGFTFTQAKNNIKKEVFEGNETFLSLTVSQLNKYYEERRGDGEVVASTNDVYESLIIHEKYGENSEEWNKYNEQLDELLINVAKAYDYDDIFLTDDSGRIVCAINKSIQGADISTREYIIDSLKGKQNWSELFYSDVINENAIVLSTPVYDKNKIIGTINFTINQEKIDKIVHDGIEKIGESGDSYLVRKDGTLLTNTRLGSFTEDAALKEKIDTKGVKLLAEAINNGNFDYRYNDEYNDYLNNPVLGALGIVMMGDTPTGLIIEIDSAEAFHGVNNLRKNLIIAILVIIVIGMIIAITISKSVGDQLNKQVKKGVDFAEAFGEGDLTKSIDANTKDEVGKLMSALNKAVVNTRALIKDTKTNSDELSSTSEELSATVEEISSQTENANARTQEIAASMEESSASAEEVSASINEIAEATRTLAQKAEEGNTTADQIGNRANEIKVRIEESRTISNTMYQEREENILKAIEKSKVVGEIEKMSNVISQITEQINLLALNAAIEAARAGEHGKGFAVVAEEVRKLSDQSSEAVSSIKVVISEVQTAFKDLSLEAKGLLNFIDDKVTPDYDTMVEAGVQNMKDSEQVSSLVEGFAASTEEILASIEQVNQAIDTVTNSIEQAASGSQDIHVNVSEISQAMEEVAKISQNQTDSAQNLNMMVQKFKV